MSRSADQIALDEKIARIRKQNEEIIRRKQEIDAEIKNAELNNAIVNVRKTYTEREDGEPSLYSDSFESPQRKTVVYPKMRVAPVQTIRPQNKPEDLVWRREREEIDQERIRRQKASSGWRREWDANKILEDERSPDVDRNPRETTFRSLGSRLSRNNDKEENAISQPERRPRWDANSNREVKPDLASSWRSQPRRTLNNDDHNFGGTPSPKRNFDASNHDARSNTFFAKPPTSVSENRPVRSSQTSGPLNLRRTILAADEDKPNVFLKVTKHTETKVQTLPETFNWRNSDSTTDDLSEHLKKIVIQVKNVDKSDAQRVVKVVSQPVQLGEASSSSSRNSAPINDSECFTPDQTKVFSFGNAAQSLWLCSSNVRAKDECSSQKILKKLPKVNPIDRISIEKSVAIQKKDPLEGKKESVATQEAGVDDQNDDEWEDVSDEEWEDVTD